jgi:hypothetical protein
VGRLPSARSVKLRELLVAAMSESEVPLSTDELREVPPDWLLPWRKGPDVYHQLRALERSGICRRCYFLDVDRPIVDPKRVYWRYTHDETFAAAMADLDRDDHAPLEDH